jgi:hypothetical protein
MKLKSRVLFVFLVSLFLINPGGVDAAVETVRVYAGTGDGQSGVGTDENQTTWYAARNYTGVVTYTLQDDQTTNAARTDRVGSLYRLYRGSLPFDTNIIPESAEILSASINLYAQESSGSVGGAKACITTHSRVDVDNVVGDDYYLSNYGSTPLTAQIPLINYQYTSFDLDPSGLDYIDSDGYTVLSVRTDYDCNDIDPGTGIKSVNWYSSESEGTSFDPYLEITYEVPDEPENKYPLYTQVESPFPSIEETATWANDTYASGTALCGEDIAACGCAITSLVMAGRNAGVVEDVLEDDVNPGNINEYLQDTEGYFSDGSVKWLAARAYLGTLTSNGKISSRFSTPKFVYTMEDIDDALTAGNKAVLGFNGWHFVWLTEKTETGYLLNDPVWYNTITANDVVTVDSEHVKDYGDQFVSARVFDISDEPIELSDYGIETQIKGTAELLYRNTLGEQVGYVDGTVILDLDHASYGDADNISLTGAAGDGGKHLIVPDASGQFTLEVIGTGVGEYSMEFYALTATGEVTSFTFSGLTFPGVTTTFSFDLETGEVTEEPITYEQFLKIMESVLADLTPQQQKFFEKWAEKMFADMETKTVSQALQTIETFGKLLVAKKVDSPAMLTVLERLSVKL